MEPKGKALIVVPLVTFLLFMAIFFFLWFNLVVIRFEEQELRALFGEEYEAYASAVPRIVPSWKARWR